MQLISQPARVFLASSSGQISNAMKSVLNFYGHINYKKKEKHEKKIEEKSMHFQPAVHEVHALLLHSFSSPIYSRSI